MEQQQGRGNSRLSILFQKSQNNHRHQSTSPSSATGDEIKQNETEELEKRTKQDKHKQTKGKGHENRIEANEAIPGQHGA